MVQLKNKKVERLTSDLAVEIVNEIFHKICIYSSINDNVLQIQMKRTTESKIAYDDSYSLFIEFLKNNNYSKEKTFYKEIQREHFSEKTYFHLITPFVNNPAKLQKFLLANDFSFLTFPNVCVDSEIIFATNESISAASSLCKSSFPLFHPNLVDGWCTRRHNMFSPDYVVIKLQKPSQIFGVNIDTAHFSGNSAQGASIQALVITLRHNRYQEEWQTILDPVYLKGTFFFYKHVIKYNHFAYYIN